MNYKGAIIGPFIYAKIPYMRVSIVSLFIPLMVFLVFIPNTFTQRATEVISEEDYSVHVWIQHARDSLDRTQFRCENYFDLWAARPNVSAFTSLTNKTITKLTHIFFKIPDPRDCSSSESQPLNSAVRFIFKNKSGTHGFSVSGEESISYLLQGEGPHILDMDNVYGVGEVTATNFTENNVTKRGGDIILDAPTTSSETTSNTPTETTTTTQLSMFDSIKAILDENYSNYVIVKFRSNFSTENLATSSNSSDDRVLFNDNIGTVERQESTVDNLNIWRIRFAGRKRNYTINGTGALMDNVFYRVDLSRDDLNRLYSTNASTRLVLINKSESEFIESGLYASGTGYVSKYGSAPMTSVLNNTGVEQEYIAIVVNITNSDFSTASERTTFRNHFTNLNLTFEGEVESQTTSRFYAVQESDDSISKYVFERSDLSSFANKSLYVQVRTDETFKIGQIDIGSVSAGDTVFEQLKSTDISVADLFDINFSDIREIKIIVGEPGLATSDIVPTQRVTTVTEKFFPEFSGEKNNPNLLGLGVYKNRYTDFNVKVTNGALQNPTTLSTRTVRQELEEKPNYKPGDEAISCDTDNTLLGTIYNKYLGRINLSNDNGEPTVCFDNRIGSNRIWGVGEGVHDEGGRLLGDVYFPYNRVDFEANLPTIYIERCPSTIQPTVTIVTVTEDETIRETIDSATKIVRKGDKKYLYGCAYVPKFLKTIVLSPVTESAGEVKWIDSDYAITTTPQDDYGVEIVTSAKCADDGADATIILCDGDINLIQSFSECSEAKLSSSISQFNKFSWGESSDGTDCAGKVFKTSETRNKVENIKPVPGNVPLDINVVTKGQPLKATIICPDEFDFKGLRKEENGSIVNVSDDTYSFIPSDEHGNPRIQIVKPSVFNGKVIVACGNNEITFYKSSSSFHTKTVSLEYLRFGKVVGSDLKEQYVFDETPIVGDDWRLDYKVRVDNEPDKESDISCKIESISKASTIRQTPLPNDVVTSFEGSITKDDIEHIYAVQNAIDDTPSSDTSVTYGGETTNIIGDLSRAGTVDRVIVRGGSSGSVESGYSQVSASTPDLDPLYEQIKNIAEDYDNYEITEFTSPNGTVQNIVRGSVGSILRQDTNITPTVGTNSIRRYVNSIRLNRGGGGAYSTSYSESDTVLIFNINRKKIVKASIINRGSGFLNTRSSNLDTVFDAVETNYVILVVDENTTDVSLDPFINLGFTTN